MNNRGISPKKFELVQSEENSKKGRNKAVSNFISKRAAIKKPFLS